VNGSIVLEVREAGHRSVACSFSLKRVRARVGNSAYYYSYPNGSRIGSTGRQASLVRSPHFSPSFPYSQGSLCK